MYQWEEHAQRKRVLSSHRHPSVNACHGTSEDQSIQFSFVPGVVATVAGADNPFRLTKPTKSSFAGVVRNARTTLK